ncbi:hypothetical protein GCM10023160_30680 [Brachybacterium paraconglomeratum]
MLFAPFYPYAGTPGLILQHRLMMALDGAGPRFLSVRVSAAQRSSTLVFSDDGRVLDPTDPGAAVITRSVSELRAMARAARIPWHTDYETSGGARAFLEVLRALNTGPVGVHRAEDV